MAAKTQKRKTISETPLKQKGSKDFRLHLKWGFNPLHMTIWQNGG